VSFLPLSLTPLGFDAANHKGHTMEVELCSHSFVHDLALRKPRKWSPQQHVHDWPTPLQH